MTRRKIKKDPNNPYNEESVRQLHRRLKTSKLDKQIEHVTKGSKDEIVLLTGFAQQVQGTPLEGLPFTVAMLKSKLLSDEEIAEELDIPVKSVRQFSQVTGFNTLINQMMPAIWSDLIITAQATVHHHMKENKDKDLAKWLLESTGQVASSRPLNLHQHNNKTLVVNGNGQPMQNMPGQPPALNGGGETITTPVEDLAHAIFQRMQGNVEKSNGGAASAPPITISTD